MSNRKQVLVAAALVVVALAAVLGYSAFTRAPAASAAMSGHVHGAGGAAAPADSQGPKMFSISEERARRIGVAYAVAHTSVLGQSVRSVGTIAYDETRQADVNPKIEGWVEKLYVDYTGAPVARGQALMSVYSPMLVSAQEELILARKLADEEKDGVAGTNAQEMLAAARRRLAYWDIPAGDIARIEQTGQTQKTLVLRSPAGGVVTEKNVVQGTRIMPGMDLFKIADLSTVWLQGEVFEKDLALVHVGQPATVTLDAYPGETFHGRVAFIAPSVDLQSRTGTVRVELANPGNRLKPGMYAALRIDVPAGRPALVVPRTAVLSTGERAIVFVRHDDGMLMPHEVKLGLAVGDSVEILAGIPNGATVVSSAAFLVDAESNLGSAIASMPGMDMGPQAPAAPAQDNGKGKGNGISGTGTTPSPSPAVSSPSRSAAVSSPNPIPGAQRRNANPAVQKPSAAPMPDMPGMPTAPASSTAHKH